ncbi:hypothetical protein C8R44DRAFT_740686 [Mycena epipterygia]|nr:hypothetical protein C8R44DRAFT_740686 [Mycena epipterygia]
MYTPKQASSTEFELEVQDEITAKTYTKGSRQLIYEVIETQALELSSIMAMEYTVNWWYNDKDTRAAVQLQFNSIYTKNTPSKIPEALFKPRNIKCNEFDTGHSIHAYTYDRKFYPRHADPHVGPSRKPMNPGDTRAVLTGNSPRHPRFLVHIQMILTAITIHNIRSARNHRTDIPVRPNPPQSVKRERDVYDEREERERAEASKRRRME